MRKKAISILIISLLVIITLSFILINQQRTKYVLPPNISLALFGTEPEDFFTTYREFYDYCEDFRKHAQIDENGNLVLKLTKEQEKAILQYCDSGLKSFDELPEVEILDDYLGFKITGNKESITNIIANEYGIFTIDEMAFRQMFNGINPKNISVTVTVIESSTNNVLYMSTWPQDDIELSPQSWEFSEEKTEDGFLS